MNQPNNGMPSSLLNARRFPSIVATALLLASLFATGPAWGRSIAIDLRSGPSGKRTKSVPVRKGAGAEAPEAPLRSSVLPAGAADVGTVEVGDELSFALFDDTTVTLTLSEKTPTPLGGDAFLAEAAGCDGMKSAVVLRTEDGLTADVQDPRNGKVYRVVSSASGVTVEEIEPSGESLCGNDALDPSPERLPGNAETPARVPVGARGASRGVRGTATDADTCVDVLVAYDKDAAAWAAAKGGGSTNFAQVAVQKMNAALANTGLSSSFRFRLVGVSVLSVSETDVHEALHAIRDGKAGWKDVKIVREEVGADIVATMIDTGSAYGTAGVGWALSPEFSPSSFSEYAYNVCAVRSVAQSHTMTHECGHNLGAGHATLQFTQPGPQLYDYSAGHYFTGTDGEKYCTIMAYASEGPGGTQIPFFSSPDHEYAGTAVGDGSHDNTRTIANTFSAASKWRDRKVPDSCSISFSPESGELFDGSLSVTLIPGKADATIRYTLDGSDPTPSSPLYSSPIRLTSTTTIKAATCSDGVCSLPFEAQYFAKDDIGFALGLPNLGWTATGDWRVQTTNTVDGIGLEASGETYQSTLATRIAGPATICFQYCQNKGFMEADVLCDGKAIWSSPRWNYWWEKAAVDIPAGDHSVSLRVRRTYEDLIIVGSLFRVDDMRVYAVQAPTLSPATTMESRTAATFAGETMVTLEPKDADDILFYTLDGSDPTVEGAFLYDGPFFLSESTHVRAVATRPGLGSSMVAEGLYLERHEPAAGEWTLDGASARTAASRHGRLVAELCWDYLGCGWSQALKPVMTSPAFTAWAALNGVYLVADSWDGTFEGTGGKFDSLYRQTPLYEELNHRIYYPTFAFHSPADPNTALGVMLARNDGLHAVNDLFYEDTVESLVAGFSSFLSAAAPLAAPVPSARDAHGRTFPFSVTLSNPNGTGTIYYTLDGSPPTRANGTRYTGAIAIPRSGTKLTAVVWPDGADAVSGLPLVAEYIDFPSAAGVDGVVWENDPDHPWTVERDSDGDIRLVGGKDPGLESGSIVSKLTATVVGPGLFSFSYSMRTRGGSTLSFRTRGSAADECYYAFDCPTNILVAAGRTAVLEWEYNFWEGDSYDYYEASLSDIAWTPYAPPASAVADLSASKGAYGDGTVLRWTGCGDAESYVAYRGTTSDLASATRLGTTDKDRYWDFTGEMGKTYYYWVSATNVWGEGPLAGPVAGWRPTGYAVSFDANGGSGEMAVLGVARGKTATLPACGFSRVGWSFAGWATSPGGSVAYADGAGFTPSSDSTLYAKWTANAYLVSLDRQGGSGGSASVTATYGSAMPKISIPKKTGCSFGGYWTEPNGEGTQYYTSSGASARDWDVASDDTLYAHWTKSLSSIAIGGPATVESARTAAYACTATYSDKSTETVSAEWSLSAGGAYGSIDPATGVFKALSAPAKRTVTVKASFGGKSATKTVAVSARVLQSLTVSGPDKIESLETAGYVCTASYDDGTAETVSASWTLPVGTQFAGVEKATGVVTSMNEGGTDQIATLRASFGGKTADKTIALLAKVPAVLHYVDAANGSDANDGLDWTSAKRTIQSAIDSSDRGDAILVAEGTYAPIDATGRRIEIRASSGGHATAIDGGGTARCATLDARAVLSGFTLRNGRADFGGGALGGKLENCRIEDCAATVAGGGASYATLSRCIVSGCWTEGDGGGLFEGSAENTVIENCDAALFGGGAFHATLTGCTVYGNVAETGAGVAGCTVRNSIVWENRLYATDKKGVRKLGNCANITEGKKTLYKNACTYTDSSPKPAGTGNLAKDPLFVDAANGDFRLQFASPVKNKGKAALSLGDRDLGGLPRLIGAPDMGAHEVPDGTPVPADYDGDGIADAAYFDAATATWIVMQSRDRLRVETFGDAKATPVPADYDGDGAADFATYSATDKAPAFRIRTQLGDEPEPVALGAKGAEPFAADFDGDGMDDPGVFQGNAKKPSFTVLLGTRGLARDATNVLSHTFGTKGAKAVAGDFDGDGLADVGCYTASASKPAFAMILSTNGWNTLKPLGITLGAKGSTPCCGDFDGDGTTDFAAYAGSAKTPILYRMFSTSRWRETRSLPFGEKGSRAATGDWDGDGAADPAIETRGAWRFVTPAWNVKEIHAP